MSKKNRAANPNQKRWSVQSVATIIFILLCLGIAAVPFYKDLLPDKKRGAARDPAAPKKLRTVSAEDFKSTEARSSAGKIRELISPHRNNAKFGGQIRKVLDRTKDYEQSF